MMRQIRQLHLRRTDRHGFTLTETTIAMLVLAVAIVTTTQLMAAVAARRLATERETVARQETANLMERAIALPWAELTEDKVLSLQLSDNCQQRLPDARLEASVEATAGRPAGRQVRIELSWRDSGGQARRRTVLTAWRYAMEEPE